MRRAIIFRAYVADILRRVARRVFGMRLTKQKSSCRPGMMLVITLAALACGHIRF